MKQPVGERGVVFSAGGDRLVGVVTVPESPASTGVVFLVGGPQYRAGSHRQYVHMARELGAAGFASIRFDYPGMGDSEGPRRGYNEVAAEVSAAARVLSGEVPAVSRIVLWGLCDAAAGALIFASAVPKVVGLALLNPWVHNEDYSPEVRLGHYYHSLFKERRAWGRLFQGEIGLRTALRTLADTGKSLLQTIGGASRRSGSRHAHVGEMLAGLQGFHRDVLVLLSENDLTAREFSNLAAHNRVWKRALARPGVRIETIRGSDHTLSDSASHERGVTLTRDWLASVDRGTGVGY